MPLLAAEAHRPAQLALDRLQRLEYLLRVPQHPGAGAAPPVPVVRRRWRRRRDLHHLGRGRRRRLLLGRLEGGPPRPRQGP